MFAMVRHYAEPRSVGEVMARVREGLVPVLRAQAGFRAYWAFAGEDGREAVSVSVFDDRETLMAANERARAWVSARLRDLLPNPPEIVAGLVLHDDLIPSSTEAANLPYVAVWSFERAAPADRIGPQMREHVLPELRGDPRFRGLLAFRTRADPTRAVGVLLLEGPEAAAEAYRRVRGAMLTKLPGAFPAEASIVQGRAQVAELA